MAPRLDKPSAYDHVTTDPGSTIDVITLSNDFQPSAVTTAVCSAFSQRCHHDEPDEHEPLQRFADVVQGAQQPTPCQLSDNRPLLWLLPL